MNFHVLSCLCFWEILYLCINNRIIYNRMITTQLLRPESIVVVGASNNVHKPGGAILKNLINGGYRGELRAVNPKETEVQGIPSFA